MLSKEQILDIISYCKNNKISRKDRLKELGLSPWSFYQSRKKYLALEARSGSNVGEFVRLSSTGEYVSDSVTGMEREVSPGKNIHSGEGNGTVSIECRTVGGGMFRLHGVVTPAMLTSIIQNL